MFGWFRPKEALDITEETRPDTEEDFSDPAQIFTAFTTLTGIHFKQKEAITTSKMIHFCRDRKIRSFESLYSMMLSDPILLEELVNFLTVNETYFFREAGQIHFMARKAAEAAKAVRILCAPGSTGEEPYSIAIALLEQGISPDLIEIVSLDINSDAIAKAKKGGYSPRALHKTPQNIQERYFLHEDGKYTVQEKIRALVHFERVNIFEESLFGMGKFDYVFSRNMLIYFDLPTAKEAIGRLARLAKSEESLFFFGHADIVESLTSLKEHYVEGIKFYTPLKK